MSVRPVQTFHCVESRSDGAVSEIVAVSESGLRANAGFFVLDSSIFEDIHEGEEIIPRRPHYC